MKINFLYSSSKGNCTVIESDTGTVITIDAGVSYKKIVEAYGEALVPKALFITHEHGDHVTGAGILARKSQCAVFMPKQSYLVKPTIFKKCAILSHIEGGEQVIVGDLTITAFSTQHDSKASVGFIIKEGDKRFAYITDTGSISKLMQVCVAGCDAYFIEADYSEELLWKHEDYTVLLKERIASPFGHLSNTQTMEFLNSLNLDELKWVTVGHLSENTNSPELVNSLFREYFPSYLDKLHIAPQKNYLTL